MNNLEERLEYLEKTVERLAKMVYELTQIISKAKTGYR